MTPPTSNLLLPLALLAAIFVGCASPPYSEWQPVPRPRGADPAPVLSETYVQIELRAIPCEAELAERWVGARRDLLRVAPAPEPRVRAVLRQEGERQRRVTDAPVVTVALSEASSHSAGLAGPGDAAEFRFVRERTYQRDFCRALTEGCEPIFGGYTVGLRGRARVYPYPATRPRAPLQLLLELDLRFTEELEVEVLTLETEEFVGGVEIPKLGLQRHVLELVIEPGVTYLIAPPIGPESERQTLVMLRTTLIELAAREQGRFNVEEDD